MSGTGGLPHSIRLCANCHLCLYGVRRWFDYVADSGSARPLPRTACTELQQVLQLPACSGIQSAGSASATHLQAGRKKAAACACAEVRTGAASCTQPPPEAVPSHSRCCIAASHMLLQYFVGQQRALDVHNFLLVVRECIIRFKRAIEGCRSIVGPSSAM